MLKNKPKKIPKVETSVSINTDSEDYFIPVSPPLELNYMTINNTYYFFTWYNISRIEGYHFLELEVIFNFYNDIIAMNSLTNDLINIGNFKLNIGNQEVSINKVSLLEYKTTTLFDELECNCKFIIE